MFSQFLSLIVFPIYKYNRFLYIGFCILKTYWIYFIVLIFLYVVEYIGFSVYSIMLPANSGGFISSLLLFFSLVWSLWLWFPIICWINVALVGTDHLLPNLREKAFSFSSLSIYVSGVFVVYSLYYLEVYFLYTNFVERFYHKRMLDDMVSWVICMFSSPSSPSTSSLSWLFSKCEEYIIKYLSFKMWTVLCKYKHATF